MTRDQRGEQEVKTARSDMSVAAGDSVREVQSAEVVSAVENVDRSLSKLDDKGRNALSPVQREAALDDLDSGAVGKTD